MAQLRPCLSEAAADGIFLRLDATNDPVTGELILDPDSGGVALDSQQAILIKSGKKLVFDGD